MSLKLGKKIDNNVFNKKTKLLNSLEKGYQAIMEYQSPEWVFKACYYSSEINYEFARFLKESPLPPGLSKADKQKYTEILNQKASGYTNKANQYLDTCRKLAEKWELCDPELTAYLNGNLNKSKKNKSLQSFSNMKQTKSISYSFLQDNELKSLHEKVLLEKENIKNLYVLFRFR